MIDVGTAVDPFACAHDRGELRAAEVVQEYWLAASRPDHVFQFEGSPFGYALTMAETPGERLLSVPGLREADFTCHGGPHATVEELAAFVADAVDRCAADHLRIPLLSPEQAHALERALRTVLPGWRVAAALAAVAPYAQKSEGRSMWPESLRRALSRLTRQGTVVGVEGMLHRDDVLAFHRGRWGDNRDERFFGMLTALLARECAEVVTVRAEDGHLLAAQFDILGASTRHYYYSASDSTSVPGIGTAVLAGSWARFADSPTQRVYSFGRGSERYKYRYATGCRELFEVRGFFAPGSSQ